MNRGTKREFIAFIIAAIIFSLFVFFQDRNDYPGRDTGGDDFSHPTAGTGI